MVVAVAGCTTPLPVPTAPAIAVGDPNASPSPAASPAMTADAPPAETASPGPVVSTLATPTPAVMNATTIVPLVPVTGFWSARRSIARAELADLLGGRASTPRLYVSDRDLEPLAELLGVAPASSVRAVPTGRVRDAIAGDPEAIGVVRAADVTPDVRALAVDGIALFGTGRTRDLATWPLLVAESRATTGVPTDPASLWTLAAGGDVMLDRAVYRRAVLERRGPDWPWDGGTARITARVCCGWPGRTIVRGRRTGHAGSVRTLLTDADLALVNLEGPAPDGFRYHPRGLVFTMDPALLRGLKGAGIDVVSLANNHIANAAAAGVADTVVHLDRLGIGHAGAGRNAAAARQAVMLTAGGVHVAVLGYNGVDVGRNATASRPGAASLRLPDARADIRAARAAGAEVVIVVPHWGREYTDAVSARQRRLARALVAAGADLVLGSHSHWAGPIELLDDRLVVYSMGDLVFDLQHDERTQQGVIVDLTFDGRRLVQVDLHPTLILGASQPNLLEPDGGGTALLDAIRMASDRLPGTGDRSDE